MRTNSKNNSMIPLSISRAAIAEHKRERQKEKRAKYLRKNREFVNELERKRKAREKAL
jgi:hypothetical protein